MIVINLEYIETMAPSSALPIGATRAVSEMQPLLVDPSQPGSGLYNAALAVIAPPNPDESERYDEEILDLHIVGFIIMYVPPLSLLLLLTFFTSSMISISFSFR